MLKYFTRQLWTPDSTPMGGLNCPGPWLKVKIEGSRKAGSCGHRSGVWGREKGSSAVEKWATRKDRASVTCSSTITSVLLLPSSATQDKEVTGWKEDRQGETHLPFSQHPHSLRCHVLHCICHEEREVVCSPLGIIRLILLTSH